MLRLPRFHNSKRLSLRVIRVVAGILQKNGEVLIAQRAESHHDGKWEFPGGKMDLGETPEEALVRELYEELNVSCKSLEFFYESSVTLGDKKIILQTYLVHDFTGKVKNSVHADVKWVQLSDLGSFQFLEADIPVVEKALIELG